jgi:hypothetical protein
MQSYTLARRGTHRQMQSYIVANRGTHRQMQNYTLASTGTHRCRAAMYDCNSTAAAGKYSILMYAFVVEICNIK